MASQVYINSLNQGLNFKLGFEKLGLKSLNPGLKLNVHIYSSNRGFKFQTRVSTNQVHIYSLNLGLNFRPGFENFQPGFEKFKHRYKTQSAHLFLKPGFQLLKNKCAL